MDAADSSEPRKRTLTIRTMHVVIGILCILLFAFVTFRISASHRVKKKLDAIRAEGYPVTLVELDEWYPEPPAGQNAADAYAEAFRVYFRKTTSSNCSPTEWERMTDLPVVGSGDLPTLSEPIPEEMLTDIAWYVGKNAEAIRFLHEAATMPACRYPIDLTTGASTLLPHLAEIRQGTRLLKLEAILAAELGDPKRAVQAVASSLALAHSLKEEPILIPRLVRIACDSLSCSALERVLSRIPLADKDLTRLASALASEDDVEAMARAMAGERCIGIASSRMPGAAFGARGGPAGGLWRGVYSLYSASGVRDLDLDKYLEIMDGYVKRTKRPFPDPERLAMHDDSVERTIEGLPRCYILTRTATSGLARASQQDAKVIAQLRCARLAVAVERYRLSHGTLPESIDALVPAFMDSIPLDPFADNPLRFKKQEKGYVVYSVGMNQIDDGGTASESEHISRRRGQPLDIVFTVER